MNTATLPLETFPLVVKAIKVKKEWVQWCVPIYVKEKEKEGTGEDTNFISDVSLFSLMHPGRLAATDTLAHHYVDTHVFSCTHFNI